MNTKQIDNKTLVHIRMGCEDVQKLDHLFINRLGYKSRNEYFNAIAAAVLYPDASSPERENKPVPASLTAWCAANVLQIPEAAIRKSLSAALRGIAFPVIAMNGATQAYELMGKDVISQVHDETGFWLPKGEVSKAFGDFELLYMKGLYDYRQLMHEGKDEAAHALWMAVCADRDAVNN